MFKLTIIILLLFVSSLNLSAITIGTAKQDKNSMYLINYSVFYDAKKQNGYDKEAVLNNLDLTLFQNIIRPVYYTDDWVFFATIPITYKKTGFNNKEVSGVDDIVLSAGYFIPFFESVDVGPVLQLKLPTGNYKNGIGTGAYEIYTELYINTIFSGMMLDTSVKYKFKFRNNTTEKKLGDEFGIESVLGVFMSKKLIVGPSFAYSHTQEDEQDGVKTHNSEKMNLKLGFDISYKVDKNLNILVNYMNDIVSQNNPEGSLVMIRISYKFDSSD